MDFVTALRTFFDAGAGQAALAVLVVCLVDFLLGVAAAFRDGTFALDAVAAFLRKHVAGRVFPIWVLLFVGHFTAEIKFGDVPILLSVGIGAAALYVAETVGSIMSSWGPGAKRSPQPVPED